MSGRDVEHGVVVDVNEVTQGGELAADVAAGSIVLVAR